MCRPRRSRGLGKAGGVLVHRLSVALSAARDFPALSQALYFHREGTGILTGRYFSRHLISGKEVDLVPGDKFRERTAYVLFKCSKDRPAAELLDWAAKIRKAAL